MFLVLSLDFSFLCILIFLRIHFIHKRVEHEKKCYALLVPTLYSSRRYKCTNLRTENPCEKLSTSSTCLVSCYVVAEKDNFCAIP